MTSVTDDFPPPLSREATIELRRRQRGRNLALLFVLIGVAVLFYAISVVKFKVH